MRLKSLGNQERVYLNPNDYQTLIDSSDSRRAEIAMRIMGEMGLRVSEVGFSLEDIYESTHPEVGIHFVTIYSKDTSGKTDDGKRRDAWVPNDLLERIEEYYTVTQRPESLPVVGESERTISRDVKESAKIAARKTGNDDFEHVSCHDFRAYFATNMMLREGVDPEVVMELGGWEDRDTMDPYIDASFDDIIQDSLADAGLLGEDIVETDPTPVELLRDEITALRDAVNELDPRVSVEEQRDDDQPGLDRF